MCFVVAYNIKQHIKIYFVKIHSLSKSVSIATGSFFLVSNDCRQSIPCILTTAAFRSLRFDCTPLAIHRCSGSYISISV